MAETQEVSIRSKKTELLNAYLQMKKKFEENQLNQLPFVQQEEQNKDENKILEKTKSYLPESLDSEISSLAKVMQCNLFEMRDKLVAEGEKLKELRYALEIETCRLEEIYNIKLVASTLQVVVEDFEQKQKELNRAKQIANDSWEEEKAKQKKEWTREQEEYEYCLKIKRQKEQDEYEIQQKKEDVKRLGEFERKEIELNERKEAIQKQELEISEMRKQIEQIPQRIDNEVKAVQEKVEKRMKDDFAVQKQISQQKWEAEKSILEAKIQNEQETIKNMVSEIVVLRKSLAEANLRIQNLAMAALSNSSFMSVKDKDVSKEQNEHR